MPNRNSSQHPTTKPYTVKATQGTAKVPTPPVPPRTVKPIVLTENFSLNEEVKLKKQYEESKR